MVRLTGLAGLVAGAFSMAAGEYVSMQAQRELLQRELDVERQALRKSPEAERRELTAIYERRGLDPGLAAGAGRRGHAGPRRWRWRPTPARSSGINPSSLGLAAGRRRSASFVTFALGALLPAVALALLVRAPAATLASVVIGAVAALASARALGFFTGRSPVRSALRQLGVGGARRRCDLRHRPGGRRLSDDR